MGSDANERGPRESPAERVSWGEEEGREQSGSLAEGGDGAGAVSSDDLAIVDAARGLNLRAGPGREHAVLAVLPNNSFVEVLELMGRYPDGCLYATEVPGWALMCPFQLPGTPEEEVLLEGLYGYAVGYMAQAGVAEPETGTPRRAQYDLCVNALVLDDWDRRGVSNSERGSCTVTENRGFRNTLKQLKMTEPDGPGKGKTL